MIELGNVVKLGTQVATRDLTRKPAGTLAVIVDIDEMQRSLTLEFTDGSLADSVAYFSCIKLTPLDVLNYRLDKDA